MACALIPFVTAFNAVKQKVDFAEGYRQKLVGAPACSMHPVIMSPRSCWRRCLASILVVLARCLLKVWWTSGTSSSICQSRQ